MNPIWLSLGAVTLVAGVLIILTPKVVVDLNKGLTKVLGSADDMVLKHRHVMGAGFMIVAYLCFRLALLVGEGF
jgi:hypothetical protein